MTDAAIAELRKSVVRPFILIDIEFADAWMHVWTGIGKLVINSITYVGLGNLLSISAISETMDVQANGLSISLSGVPSNLAMENLVSCQHGLPVTLSFGFMTEAGTVIASPVTLGAGLMDSASMDEAPDTCKITITIESRLADLQRARIVRFTDEDQERLAPGDRGFVYVPTIQDWNQAWGKSR